MNKLLQRLAFSLTTLALIALAGPALADTTVSGRIAADTTWSLAGSPYVVTSTIQVYGTTTAPVTLTIEPGVEVRFASGAGLQIGYGTSQGALIARGTAEAPITFTRNTTTGTWGQVNFQDGTVDATTALEHVNMQYGTGVSMTLASPVLRSCVIQDLSGYISLSSSNPVLENVTVANSSTYGIYLSSSSPAITGGSLTNANATGQGIYGSGSPVISGYSVSIANTVGKYGLYLSSTTSSLSVTNSTIGNGLYLSTTAIAPTITGNTFTNSDASPLHAGANIIAAILGSNTFTGLTSAGRIEVVGEQVKQDALWKKWAAPYVLSGTVSVYKDTVSPATLTIEPGADLRFASGAGVQVGSGASKGALVARGTAAEPITFTRSAASGTWGTLNFQDGTVDAATVLEYVNMQYGTDIYMYTASPLLRNCNIQNTGSYGLYLSAANPTMENVVLGTNTTYGIYLSSSSPTITGGSLTNANATGQGIYGSGSPVISDHTVSIVNTTGKYGLYLTGSTSALSVADSTVGNGLYLAATNISPAITGNTFTNSDSSPLHAGANIIAAILNSNTFSGLTSAGRIEVVGEQVKQDALWKKWAAPYVLSGTVSVYKDTVSPATLTIEPGADLRFASGAGVQVGSGANKGALAARGTAAEPVTFTRSAASGTWGTLNFQDGTVDAATVLEYVNMQYGTDIYMYTASPLLRNCNIQNTGSYGLYLSAANPTMENVVLGTNTTYGIYLSNSSPTITGGSLTNANATGQGIYGSGSPVISGYSVSIANTVGKYGLYLSSTTSSLSVTNSTIGNGLYVATTAITPTITGNTFTNSDASPLHAGANIIAAILDGNTFSGMTSAGRIEVVGEQVKQDALWKKWPAPYVISGTVSVYKDTVSPATLTIEPGMEMRFASGAGVQVGSGANKGALVARGTVAEPITFTRSAASGTWGTLNFQDGTVDAATVLEHVYVRYGTGIYMYTASPVFRSSSIQDATGSYGFYLSAANPALEDVALTNNGAYGIFLSNASPQITGGSLTNASATGHGIYGSGSPAITGYTVSIVNTPGKYGFYWTGGTSAMSLTDSTIGNGIYISTTGLAPTITGNTFTNSDSSPLHAGANIIGSILNGNTFTEMTTTGKIEVVAETVTQDTLWKKWPAPYVLSGTAYVYKDTVTPSTLTIEAGAQLRFNSGARLNVGNGTYKGILTVQGVASDPVVFTANQATPTAGFWGGVTFSGAAAGPSLVEHAVIEYAGSGGSYSSANIYLASSSPTIRNSLIRNSAGSGIYLSSASATPQIFDCEITGNTWGVYASASNPRIGNSRIYGNATAGIWNASTTVVVDARGNWWGAATGPAHAANPDGSGNLVTDKVIYDPWLTQAPTAALSITDPSVQPAVLNPAGGSVTFAATLSAPADWAITVTDGTGATVKTLTGNGAAISQPWGGETDQGGTVVNGSYSYRMEATNGAGMAAPVKGTLGVSSQITAVIATPADNQMFPGGTSIDVTGTATAISDFKNYVLDYGSGDNPASWTQLKSSTTPINNALIYAWNPASLTGSSYTLRLTVNDNLGNTAVIKARVRFLKIESAAGSEGYISPNGDGVKDATVLSATFTYPSDWAITIKDSTGNPIKTYTGNGNAVSQLWDGRNEVGAIVPDGLYTWQVDARSPETGIQAPAKSGAVTVDSTLPAAQVASPASGATVFNTVEILGTASDTNLDYYRLEYEPVGGTAATLVQAAVAVNAGTLATWTTNDGGSTPLLPNGEYLLWLTVADKAGNTASVLFPVTVDNLLVTDVGATTHTLDTYLSETATIQFSVNAPATATLKIIPELQGPTGAPVYQVSQDCPVSGVYTFAWNGRTGAGNVVPDEAYLYVIEVADGGRTDSYAPPKSTAAGTVTCSQEAAYYPYKNDPLTVTYGPAQASRVDIHISWGAQYFKIVDGAPRAAGSYSFDWDGKDPSGEVLNGGGKAYCSILSPLAENFIVTTGDTPKVKLVHVDPYQMDLAYGQFTRIAYEVFHPALVSISLIDPAGNSYVLIENQLRSPGTYEVEWQASDLYDATGKRQFIQEEGDYTIRIQARNPSTGTSSAVNGSLRVGY